MASSPKKERPSAQEIALARQAGQKDQRYEQAFRPLEQAAIQELSTADAGTRAAMLAGRSNADLEAEAAKGALAGNRGDMATGTFGSGGTASRGFRRAGAVEDGRNSLRVSADQQARNSIDQDTLNVIKTGQGMARTNQSSLTASARQASQLEQSKIAAENMKDAARTSALLEMGMAAGFRGYDEYSKKGGIGDQLVSGSAIQKDAATNPQSPLFDY